MAYRMYAFSVVLALLFMTSAAAQKKNSTPAAVDYTYDGFTFPDIATKGKKLSDFIPSQWLSHDTAYADLNGDGHTDAILHLKHKDALKVHHNSDGSSTPVYSHSVLLVLYHKHGHYERHTYCYKLPNCQAGMGQPGVSVKAEKQTITVSFYVKHTHVQTTDYLFTEESNRWVLARVDERGSNATSSRNASYDYRTDSLHHDSVHEVYDETTGATTSHKNVLNTLTSYSKKYFLDNMECLEFSPQVLLDEE